MTSTIAAITTGGGGVVTTADASGNLSLLSGATTILAATATGVAVTGTLSASGATTLSSTLAVTGVTTVQAGTAAAPAITTSGDTNTGIFFPAADTIAFGEGGAEAMRINSSGNVLIGATTQAAAARSTVQTATDNSRFMGFQSSAGAEIGYIFNNTTATQYSTSSDYRLKDNVAPMIGALAKVAALKPVTYKWKSDGSDGQGFIAHELQEVVPDCVTGEKDAVDSDGNAQYQGVDTSFLVATLVASIQELKAIIDVQATRIAALESV